MMILGFHLNSRSKLTVEGIPNNVMSWPITKPKLNSKQDTMGLDEEQNLEASNYVQRRSAVQCNSQCWTPLVMLLYLITWNL